MGPRRRRNDAVGLQMVFSSPFTILVGLGGLFFMEGLAPGWRLLSACIVLLGITSLVLALVDLRRQ